jgi:hypothetical protein
MWASSENEDRMKELNCASSFLSAARASVYRSMLRVEGVRG